MDYRLEVKEVEKEGGEERSISSTRKTVRKRDNADMAISSNSQNITEIVEDTNSMEISESNREDGLSAILCAYLHPIAMIVTLGVSEWTTDSR